MPKRINILRKIEFCTLFILILISPFVFNQFGVDVFRLPKEVFSRILIVLMLGVCLIEALERRLLPYEHKVKTEQKGEFFGRMHGTFKKVFVLPALVLLAALLSVCCSKSVPISAKQLLNLALFVSIPYVIFFCFNSLKKINVLLNAAVFSGFITSAYCILQFMGKDFLFKASAQYRGMNEGWILTSGFIDNPNLVGGYLASLLPLVLTLFYTNGNRTKKVIVFLIFCFISSATILTRAKTSLLSFFISLLFFFICMRKYVWRTLYKSVTFWVFTLFCVVFFSVYIYSNKQYIQNISNMGEEISFKTGERALYWTVAAAMMLDRPVFGHGIGTYKYHYLDYKAFLKRRISTPFTKKYKIAQQAHNEFLQFGAETGLVGLFSILALLFYYFSMGFKVLNERAKLIPSQNINIHDKQVFLIGFLSTALCLAINSLANFPFHIVPSALIGACVLGFGMVACFGELDICFLFFKDTFIKRRTTDVLIKNIALRSLIVRVSQLAIISLVVYSTTAFLGPFLADMHLKSGLALERNKHLRGGIYRLKEAASLSPSDGNIRYELGLMQLKAAESSENGFAFVNKFLYLNRAAYQLELAEMTFKLPALNFLRAYCQELIKNKRAAYAEYSKALFYDSSDAETAKRREQLNIKHEKPSACVVKHYQK